MEEVKRYDLIQKAIDHIKNKKEKVNYLEIGVQTGLCLFKIKADKKLAVDPQFRIKITKRIKAYIKNLSNFNNEFFELTSDDFFEQKADYIKTIGGLDVVFIDGLHLYEQVLKDIKNSLNYLNEGGIVLLHDCSPLSETAALRGMSSEEVMATNPPNWKGIWNGDVWKSIVVMRSERPDLKIIVFDCDHGIGMIKKGNAEGKLSFSSKEIEELKYADLDKDRSNLLNLKSPNNFKNYLV
jgi:hypothetical protein